MNISRSGRKRGFLISSPEVVRGGFTLVEVAVALIVLAIVVVGSSGFFYHSLAMIEEYKSERLAMEIATSEMDEIRKRHYADIGDYDRDGFRIANWDAVLETRVQEVTEGDARHKVVDIKVLWGMPIGERSYRLQTIVGRRR